MIVGQEPAQALELLIELNRAHPDDASTIFLLGEAHYALDQFEPAITQFERGLTFAPGQRARAFNLGRAYEKLGRFEDSTEIFLAMMQSEDSKLASKGHFGMGLTFEAQGELEKANQVFRKATELNPANHRALYKVALDDLKSKSLEAARDRFLEVLRLRPLHHGAAYNLSLAYTRLGEPGKSKEARERWVAIRDGKQKLISLHAQLRQEPTNVRIMEAIARQNHDLRQYRDAFQWYRRALAIEPNSTRLLILLAQTLEEGGNSRYAIALYEELLDRDPPVRAALAPLVKILRRDGRAAEAEALEKRFAPKS